MATIRNATLDDIHSITLLLDSLGYPSNFNEVKQRLENIAAHKDYKTLLAIDETGQIAGMIGLSKNYFYEYNGQYIRVLALVVIKDHRMKGIGKLLIQQAEKWAKEINSTTIVLNCGNRQERENAFIFYQKMGYVIKSSGFIKKLTDQSE